MNSERKPSCERQKPSDRLPEEELLEGYRAVEGAAEACERIRQRLGLHQRVRPAPRRSLWPVYAGLAAAAAVAIVTLWPDPVTQPKVTAPKTMVTREKPASFPELEAIGGRLSAMRKDIDHLKVATIWGDAIAPTHAATTQETY